MLVIFLWIGTTLPFFHSEGNLLVFRNNLKIIFRGLQIASPHSFTIGILIISWPWALFESWLLIIWRMSDSEKSQEVKVCSIRNFNSDSYALLFGMREHWLAKKEAKRPPTTSFSPVTSTNLGIRPKNFLTFNYSPLVTLV